MTRLSTDVEARTVFSLSWLALRAGVLRRAVRHWRPVPAPAAGDSTSPAGVGRTRMPGAACSADGRRRTARLGYAARELATRTRWVPSRNRGGALAWMSFAISNTPATRTAAAPHRPARPNPSVNRTRHGMRLGPRGGFGHHPPRGPSHTPRRAGYLERSASAVTQGNAP
jgi:hypothetical protein